MPEQILLHKGKFKPIDTGFLVVGHEVLEEVAKVQEEYHKEDTDTFINELRDSIAGYYLGYRLVNTDKHGFDCKLNEKDEIFLEVKSASFAASTWGATFNDTTLEKAGCFKTNAIFLCLAVWKNASNLLFCCYGQNKDIGFFLEDRVKKFLTGKGGVRSTQTLSISQLVFQYGFDIVCINKSKEEVKHILQLKSRAFLRLPDEQLLSVPEYQKKYGFLNLNKEVANV